MKARPVITSVIAYKTTRKKGIVFLSTEKKIQPLAEHDFIRITEVMIGERVGVCAAFLGMYKERQYA